MRHAFLLRHNQLTTFVQILLLCHRDVGISLLILNWHRIPSDQLRLYQIHVHIRSLLKYAVRLIDDHFSHRALRHRDVFDLIHILVKNELIYYPVHSPLALFLIVELAGGPIPDIVLHAHGAVLEHVRVGRELTQRGGLLLGRQLKGAILVRGAVQAAVARALRLLPCGLGLLPHFQDRLGIRGEEVREGRDLALLLVEGVLAGGVMRVRR